MNLSDLPLVSIVTPVYNMARYIPTAIESVRTQDYPHIEHIVVDGGSTDGTLELLERHRDTLRYSTATDKGPGDAAYRGLREARGDVLAWLNADDAYLPGAVRTAVEYLLAHPEVDVVYGEGYWIDENGGRIARYPTLPFDAKLLQRDCLICQPAAFFRAASYRRCELDPDVNQSFDYDLWIRMAKRDFVFASIPQFLAASRMHSGAKTLREREDVFQASMGLLKRHYGYIPFQWVFGYTAFRIDGRDQFFQPVRPSFRKYVASLPAGFRYNPGRRCRYFAEWLAAPLRALVRRLSQRRG